MNLIMAWSDQQYPVSQDIPQNMPQSMPQNPLQPVAPVPSAMPAPMPPIASSYANQPQPVSPMAPLAAPSPPMPAPAPNNTAGQYAANPLVQSPLQPSPQLAPVAAPAAGMQAAAAEDDGKVGLDDVQWVNRAKRAIMSSRGDPHRQVQLMQHLRSQYLKQRFGRTVHTDEG
jgi:hypothetical protein